MLWQDFLARFATGAKVQNNCQILLKREETSVVLKAISYHIYMIQVPEKLYLVP